MHNLKLWLLPHRSPYVLMIHSATVNIEVLYICMAEADNIFLDVRFTWLEFKHITVVVFSLRPNLVHLIGALNLWRRSPH